MLLRQLPGGLYFRLGHVMGIDAGDPHSGPMDAHHDVERLEVILVKNGLQHPDDEFLPCIVVVVQQHAPQPRPVDTLVAQRIDQRRIVWTGTYCAQTSNSQAPTTKSSRRGSLGVGNWALVVILQVQPPGGRHGRLVHQQADFTKKIRPRDVPGAERGQM